MAVTIVDSTTSLVALLDCLESLPTNPPSLYLDLEGVRLSRHGSISILQVLVLPINQTFLVDVHLLQHDAFRTPNHEGTTLRSILESELLPKVLFDVRNDNDALFTHFQVSLGGVRDIQLMEVASRSYPKKSVVGLAKCIESDIQLTPEAKEAWKAKKQSGLALFEPKNGGSYEIFNVRPMQQEIVDYCTNDVVYLPALWSLYSQKLSKKWAARVQEETCKRLLLSKAATYEPNGKHKALSPWATLGKNIKPNRSGGREMVGMQNTAKKHESAAEISAMKSAQRLAAKQPQSRLAQHSLVVRSNLHQPPQTRADLKASKNMLDTKERSGHLSSLTNLPVRSKPMLNQRPLPKSPSTFIPAALSPCWICSTCNRAMQDSQKQQHLEGKLHIARLKQEHGAVPAIPAHITTTKDDPLGTATVQVTSSRNSKAKRNAKPHQVKPRQLRPTAFTPQEAGAAYPDWGFVGFGESSVSHSSCHYGDFYMEDLNYGICDNDCGWCGHCMNGIDV